MFEQAINYKNELYKELARLGKGLSSDRRLEILDLLTQAPKTVEAIANEVGTSVANTSRHLQILKDSRLVKTERNGNHIIYSLSSPQISELIHLLISIGGHELSDMKSIQHKADTQDNVKTISLAQAKEEYQKSLVLDVRPTDEYATGHIQPSINIPLEVLKDKMTSLPKNKKIIVYCRGRLCANSNIATQILNSNGFNAVSLNSSYYDWNRVTK
ncbi:ArsR/SmtB family transcription factor [Limosilactobacillus sp.]|jgi:rhodanese-related sulfurtransferase/DNA-binding transcriptional ArsR family regulator|uniref:ArsR/SmtB family transcription factor n=1 Tax=Limosilactobacillus sp. TaxID=2773925 RepID=UPI0025C71552|nr:metalloregulator ArsR/SmtB family transcription factor [Limosilactobacillus sp.]MCI2031501.1 metalloregulator ArsR/SmtB family transcription factor [Limosilactobacillus sp.]